MEIVEIVEIVDFDFSFEQDRNNIDRHNETSIALIFAKMAVNRY